MFITFKGHGHHRNRRRKRRQPSGPENKNKTPLLPPPLPRDRPRERHREQPPLQAARQVDHREDRARVRRFGIWPCGEEQLAGVREDDHGVHGSVGGVQAALPAREEAGEGGAEARSGQEAERRVRVGPPAEDVHRVRQLAVSVLPGASSHRRDGEDERQVFRLPGKKLG